MITSECKSCSVRYFASLREKTGKSMEALTTSAMTLRDLYQELADRYQFSLSTEILQVAVNQRYVPWNTILNDQDVVAFIPPVTGG